MTKIPPKPKRPLNAYLKFIQEKRDTIKQQNPDKKITELTQILAEEFKKLSPEEKQKYEGDYHKQMDEWKKEMEKYNEKYGE